MYYNSFKYKYFELLKKTINNYKNCVSTYLKTPIKILIDLEIYLIMNL